MLNTAHSGFLPQGAGVLVGKADMSQVTWDNGVGTDDTMVVGTGRSGSPRKGPTSSQRVSALVQAAIVRGTSCRVQLGLSPQSRAEPEPCVP